MKKFILLIITLLGIISWQACTYEWLETPPKPSVVSFSADIMPIFDNGCNNSACHGPGGTAPDLSEGNAYNSLIDMALVDTAAPENSILYKEVAPGGSMNKYTQLGDSDYILKWIQDGAQNN